MRKLTSTIQNRARSVEPRKKEDEQASEITGFLVRVDRRNYGPPSAFAYRGTLIQYPKNHKPKIIEFTMEGQHGSRIVQMSPSTPLRIRLIQADPQTNSSRQSPGLQIPHLLSYVMIRAERDEAPAAPGAYLFG